jgi:hypothetical protein
MVQAVALALAVAGCGPEPLAVDGARSQTLSVKAGREFEITLHTTGPGEYASPPTFSTPAVRFLEVRVLPPFTPGGPTQRFRFLAVSSGRTIIVFQHTQQEQVVEDTVNVS